MLKEMSQFETITRVSRMVGFTEELWAAKNGRTDWLIVNHGTQEVGDRLGLRRVYVLADRESRAARLAALADRLATVPIPAGHGGEAIGKKLDSIAQEIRDIV